ncbi:MAG: 16S rRNA (guanine(527)-N(7))-methyltransferase RsmG, partial [Rhodothermales bacterium]|nr:16S rRNA (guanine(527)-N(7))-methyltransferase RsmG [Rhodothermales bacterium]
RWTRHILHSLCLAWKRFPAGARIADWGTGGGLPAIPLAIAFPDVRFLAVDAIGRKVMAVRAVIRSLDIHNIEVLQSRAEECDARIDYSVSRATAPLSDLWSWHVRTADPAYEAPSSCWTPGLVCLKGGDLTEEIAGLQDRHPGVQVQCISLADIVSIPEFVGKVIVTVTAASK